MKNECLYPSQRKLAEEFGLNFKTVASRLKEMRELPERYGNYSIIDDGNLVLVYRPAFIDYMRYRRRLMDTNLRKHVEPYDPKKIISELGLETDPPRQREPKEIDKGTLRQMMKEILIEGIGA